MRKPVREVSEYWKRKHYKYVLDTEVLDVAVMSMLPSEISVLEKGQIACMESAALTEAYTFLMHKAFNRHNDMTMGRTWIDDDDNLVITDESAITELDISLETLKNCNKSLIYKISDVSRDVLPTLELQAIAELTAAIIIFNAEHENAACI